MTKTVFKEEDVFLHPVDSKDNRYFYFDVPEKTKKLFITYSYSPKNLEDKEKSVELIKENILHDAPDDIDIYPDYSIFMPLKNLVTVSLDSPEDFRGAAHRHDETQFHEIGEHFASPGFLKGKIIPGKWRLSLNIHAVVTDVCTCRIKIEGEAE